MQKRKHTFRPRVLELLEPRWRDETPERLVRELDDVFWLRSARSEVEQIKAEVRHWADRVFTW